MKGRDAATPLTLIFLAGAAAAYAYLVDRRTISDADREARRHDVFPSLRVDEVTRVELVRGREHLVLERPSTRARRDAPSTSAGWTMSSPRRADVDAAAVDVLLRELELAVRLRDVPGPESHGLDVPRVTGTVKAGSIVYRFELGDDAPRPEGAAYLRVDHEGTFVVGQSLKVQLLRGADAYRDRNIAPLGAAELARIDVRGPPARGFALERHDATFRLVGSGLRASRTAVEHVLSALADARADSFLDDDAPDAASEPWAVTLTAQSASSPGVELRLGSPCPVAGASEIVVLRSAPSPAAMCTGRELLDALGFSTDALADRALFHARADEVEQARLELVGGGRVVDLARTGAGWHERAPRDRDLDADESESAGILIGALVRAKGSSVARPAAGESFTPRARVTLSRAGGAVERVELANAGPDGLVAVRRLDDGAVLAVAPAQARRLQPHPVALRGRAVFPSAFDPRDVVSIEDGCTRPAERVERRDGVWGVSSPAGFDADASTIEARARTLARARADAWIAETDDGGFGFGGPGSCTVAWTVAAPGGGGPPRRFELEFGGEGDGGVYARTRDDAAVFVLPEALRGTLSRSAVDGGRLRLDGGGLTDLVLARDGVRVAFDRSAAGGWTVAPASGPVAGENGQDAGDPAASRLDTALAELRAEAALHTGPALREEGLQHPALEVVARFGADAGARGAERHVWIGAPTRLDGQNAFFARVSGVDATFAVPGGAVEALLDAWR